MSPPNKLFRAAFRRAAAALASVLMMSSALAQDNKPKPAPPADHAQDLEIARYCSALAPSTSEARVANQLRRLADLERQVREAAEKLEARQSAAREWVVRREDMLSKATADVVAIYAKMAPDAAGAALATMDEGEAAAVLSKLKPQIASAILGEMPAEKAAKLSWLIGGGGGAARS